MLCYSDLRGKSRCCDIGSRRLSRDSDENVELQTVVVVAVDWVVQDNAADTLHKITKQSLVTNLALLTSIFCLTAAMSRLGISWAYCIVCET